MHPPPSRSVITGTSALVVLNGRTALDKSSPHTRSAWGSPARAREHALAGVTSRNFNDFYSKATRDNIAVTAEVIRSESYHCRAGGGVGGPIRRL